MLKKDCDCKEQTSYIEGKGCMFMGALNGFCNETIKCNSYNTKCSTKKGDGIYVCERFYDTIQSQYRYDLIEKKKECLGENVD
jgi:hypothetical protein